MMGINTEQKELFSYSVDLDQRMPQDHPLRKIRETIDFTFTRDEVKRFYGYNGNESVDPAIIMQLMFILFYDNIASERELMRTIQYRMDYMWFLGYGLAQHKGYPTAYHLAALREHGPTAIHRMSFAPCRQWNSRQWNSQEQDG